MRDINVAKVLLDEHILAYLISAIQSEASVKVLFPSYL